MFGSFSRSWGLIKASWTVLRADKELLVFPVVSIIGLIVVSIGFLIPLAGSGVLDALAQSSGSRVAQSGTQVLGVIIGFLYYFVTYTVIIFSNVALVGAAMIRLDGGDPTVQDGFRIASERAAAILGYAAIAATVGMILKMIQNRSNIVAQIAAGIIGMAWNLATYMVVPVLVIEKIGPIDAIKRSGSLLKQTWGEQITGSFSIGLVMFLIMLAGCIVIGVPLFLISPFLGIAGIVLIIAVGSLISSALSGIFQAALYRYAAEGKESTFFEPAMIEGAFKPKRG